MLYAAKCYWPEISPTEFAADVAPRLAEQQPDGPSRTAYLGSLVFAGDQLVLCLYEGPSPSEVTHATERARIPRERIMEAVWLPVARQVTVGASLRWWRRRQYRPSASERTKTPQDLSRHNREAKGANMSPRVQWSFRVLLTAVVLLTLSAPAVALKQRGHGTLVAPALRDARAAADSGAQVVFDPPSSTPWPSLGSLYTSFGFGSALVGSESVRPGLGLQRPGAGSLAWRSLLTPTWASIERADSNAPGYVALDGSPGFPPVADTQTGTVYVPITCQDPTTNDSCNQTASNVLDVINSQTCNASVTSDCHVVASAAAGDLPDTATMDDSTDTVYVGDGGGSGAITVVDGATCNASVTSGCATPVASIKLDGAFPDAAALDRATDTLYVASPTGEVLVLDISDCNSTTVSGCDAPVRSIKDSLGPDALSVDVATDTVYVANGSGDTVSVINGATCNATQSSGCGQTPAKVTVGQSPQWDVVDPATDTIYVANADSGSVSVIDGATCNATHTSGCHNSPPAVLAGTEDDYLALDPYRHTVFVLNSQNDTMSEIDTNICNATDSSGCPAEASNGQVPFNPPAGGPPNSFALVSSTGTAYLVNAGGESLEIWPSFGWRLALTSTLGGRVSRHPG
jgi:YVTN family beta-propeller protein